MKKHALLAFVLLASCSDNSGASDATTDDAVVAEAVSSRSAVDLGKQLFFDRRISATGRVACATCHDTSSSGEDNHAFSLKPDGKPSKHAVPTVWNAKELPAFFWTGAAPSLEAQAEGPLAEMGLGDPDEVVRRVAAIPGYAAAFHATYPKEPSVSLASVTRAIATFERTLVTHGSPYERFVGGDASALSEVAQRGGKRFRDVGCASCHAGDSFGPTSQTTFARFPKHASSPYVTKYHLADDQGRAAVTGDAADANSWRIAPLREVARTAPYFHNGQVPTLEEAVRVMGSTELNVTLAEDDVTSIAAFLRALSGNLPKLELPRLPDLPPLDAFPAWVDP